MPFGQAVKPNRPGLIPGTNAYINNNFISTSGSTLTPTDKGSAKLDHTFSGKHRLGFLYNITRFRTEVGAGGPPGLPIPLWDGLNPWFDSQDYRMSYDWTISPRMLNHISVGANQFNKYEGTPNRFGGWKGQGHLHPERRGLRREHADRRLHRVQRLGRHVLGRDGSAALGVEG